MGTSGVVDRFLDDYALRRPGFFDLVLDGSDRRSDARWDAPFFDALFSTRLGWVYQYLRRTILRSRSKAPNRPRRVARNLARDARHPRFSAADPRRTVDLCDGRTRGASRGIGNHLFSNAGLGSRG